MSGACRSNDSNQPEPAPLAAPNASSGEPAPEVLYLPDAHPSVLDLPTLEPAATELRKAGRCPSEMVDVRGQFCIDRYEVSLEDRRTQQALSPYYHPTARATRASYERWSKSSVLTSALLGSQPELPLPPPFQLEEVIEPVATQKVGVHPSGYLNQTIASAACENAGKRLCSADEWILACRGEQDTPFPYGSSYEPGRCNVFRDAHPARLLHGDASLHHTDPRLNLVEHRGEPLLLRTGHSACKSTWGSDAIYDMVGNLDEWTLEPEGTFRGGFYARATRAGCEAAVSSHPPEYFDYSLGARCCK